MDFCVLLRPTLILTAVLAFAVGAQAQDNGVTAGTDHIIVKGILGYRFDRFPRPWR